ncbi:carbohydrate ABC transporter permease [Microbacterium sp. 4R-513]|uniref:carbohydrate ABC transporter permease n=1 Tax=Microbacterium sp. 4R-513 TaxID=2567934 RepID=UPI0013E1621D|nr:carbohydrate ABC transporter permease [Microbacterium sp. 4R-513]QIG40123.1 carbohydrate ABC transporter permease [Microbacterium sp. 4R-513]
MIRRGVERGTTYVVAIAIASIFIIPMVVILLTSFKSPEEASTFDLSLPREWLFSNYVEVLNDPAVARGFLNSVIITTGVTVITVVVCALAAFVIARRTTRITKGVYFYLLAGMVAPFAFVPAIKVLQMLGLANTHAGLILTDVAVQIPFTTLLLVGFISQLPRELDEAAIIDGAGRIRLFFQVIFPLLRPVTLTCVILLFTYAWNEFQNVLFLVGPDVWTMPMTVFNFQGTHTYNYALVCANLVVTIVPILIVFIAAQKYITSGITSGALKS